MTRHRLVYFGAAAVIAIVIRVIASTGAFSGHQTLGPLIVVGLFWLELGVWVSCDARPVPAAESTADNVPDAASSQDWGTVRTSTLFRLSALRPSWGRRHPCGSPVRRG
jgi:hypothetical protein